MVVDGNDTPCVWGENGCRQFIEQDQDYVCGSNSGGRADGAKQQS